MTLAERAEIDSVLTKAVNELKINGDAEAAKTLFDGVREKIVSCPDIVVTQTYTALPIPGPCTVG